MVLNEKLCILDFWQLFVLSPMSRNSVLVLDEFARVKKMDDGKGDHP